MEMCRPCFLAKISKVLHKLFSNGLGSSAVRITPIKGYTTVVITPIKGYTAVVITQIVWEERGHTN